MSPNGQGTPEDWREDERRQQIRNGNAMRARMSLRQEIENGDTEAAHSNADKVLCDLLVSLGYKDVVEDYQRVEKWYA